jgi:iron complex outermembrane receptor protein
MRTFAYAALWGAAMGILLPVDADAQQAPATAAGDVSASEATPLPPLDVTAPSEPLSKPKVSKAKKGGGTTASASTDEADASGSGSGQGGGSGDGKGVFTLGQLSMIGGVTVSNETMWTFNTNRLDQAAALAPGVSMQSYGGRRNETDVMVRGFDRWRVPLTMDGARIYLPADGRLDMARFLTPDVAEIQIQKGYVSVLNGPGGMGGSINLVSRKPTKDLESEARAGVTLDGDDISTTNSVTSYGRIGTKKAEGYAQISGTVVNQNGWNLSDDFVPTNTAYEDGGQRNGSETKDWSINGKIGYTPNATDEYAINFNSQQGEKGAPLHVKGEGSPTENTRFWTWPSWDISTLSGFSYTKLGEASYVKTNAYYNKLKNQLRSFDNVTYTSQNNPYAFDSWYDDYAYGGSTELGTNLIPMNTLKGSLTYRLDDHKERNNNRPTNTTPGLQVLEAWQETQERNWSIAAEDTFHVTKNFDIVGGVSRDYADLIVAEEWDATNKKIFDYPTGKGRAWNWQSAAIYRYGDDGKVYASVSDRTRFPTIFERFSSRFGTAIANPDLKAEEARNWEIGWGDTFNRRLKVSSSVFYTQISDYIDVVFVAPNTRQNQNIGDGTHKGFELSVDYDLMPGLRVGGNYTLLKRELNNPSDPSLKPTGTPENEAFLYVAWDAMRNLTITPNLQLASDRWSAVTAVGTPAAPPTTYIETGSYALVNLNVEYRIDEHFTTSFGARNLTDENYMLTEGFPEPGRQFYANARAQF